MACANRPIHVSEVEVDLRSGPYRLQLNAFSDSRHKPPERDHLRRRSSSSTRRGARTIVRSPLQRGQKSQRKLPFRRAWLHCWLETAFHSTISTGDKTM